MLIVPIKEGEAIEKALKKFKKKFEKTGVVKELRERSKFTKPSIVYREGKKKAIYKHLIHMVNLIAMKHMEKQKKANLLINQKVIYLKLK